jgi:hypothetical protein
MNTFLSENQIEPFETAVLFPERYSVRCDPGIGRHVFMPRYHPLSALETFLCATLASMSGSRRWPHHGIGRFSYNTDADPRPTSIVVSDSSCNTQSNSVRLRVCFASGRLKPKNGPDDGGSNTAGIVGVPTDALESENKKSASCNCRGWLLSSRSRANHATSSGTAGVRP